MFHIRLLSRARTAARLGIATLLASLPNVVCADPPTTTPATPSGSASTGIVANGAVYGWGLTKANINTYTNSNTPALVTGLASGVTAVSAGGEFSLALQNGAVYAWGDNAAGQLGDNAAEMGSSTPVAVSNMGSGVTAIAGGGSHGLAIKNGIVYAWGNNNAGQLGNNSTIQSNVPVAVSNMTSGVTAIAGGDSFSLAIKNGAAYAWGYNQDGELGNPSVTNYSTVPVAVSNMTSGVTAVAGGAYHGLAIKNGAAYAWGYNNYGGLGDGTTTERYSPVAVYGLSSGVTAVAGGYGHSLALKNGNVYAWGYNGQGQLGNNSTTNSLTPIQVDPTDLQNIVAIAAGDQSSYALAADGSLWVWGDNSSGQLGLGSTTTQYYTTPQHLSRPSGSYYAALFTGKADHALAIAFVPPSTFFNDEAYLSNGVFYLSFASGNPFGYYSFFSDPHYIYHFDLGYEYVYDANDGNRGVYFYDFASNTFFYTSPGYPFPYLYDFTLKSVLYYYPNTNSAGHYTTNPRYFYDFATSTVITK